MSDHEYTCPGCGRLYVCDEDDQDPPCCNREALRAEVEKLSEERDDLAAKIENATMSMAETQPTWGYRISRVLGALGMDFGGPEVIDAGIKADVSRQIGYQREDDAAEIERLRAEIERLWKALTKADALLDATLDSDFAIWSRSDVAMIRRPVWAAYQLVHDALSAVSETASRNDRSETDGRTNALAAAVVALADQIEYSICADDTPSSCVVGEHVAAIEMARSIVAV